jgi:hypothetical protein
MPPRWICVSVVLACLSVNGWLFYHDILPFLLPGQPPIVSIEPLDEVQQNRPPILWTVFQDNRKVYQARTGIEHPKGAAEIFVLTADFAAIPGQPPVALPEKFPQVEIREYHSKQTVDPDGNFLGIDVTFVLAPVNLLQFQLKREKITVRIHGQVADGVFRPILEMPDLVDPRELPPVKMPAGPSILQPFHPHQRLSNLWPGQRWSVSLFNPIMASLAAMVPGGEGLLPGGDGHTTLKASVRDRPESLERPKQRTAECFVIDHTSGEDDTVNVYVEVHTGKVLRQVAKINGTALRMDRDGD